MYVRVVRARIVFVCACCARVCARVADTRIFVLYFIISLFFVFISLCLILYIFVFARVVCAHVDCVRMLCASVSCVCEYCVCVGMLSAL